MVEGLAALLTEVADEAVGRRSTGDPTLDALRRKADEWIESAMAEQIKRTQAHLARLGLEPRSGPIVGAIPLGQTPQEFRQRLFDSARRFPAHRGL